jgi:uncharacterized protein DUF6614
MIVLHGLFELKDGCGEVEFRRAFDAFSIHLQQQTLLVGWRFMRRKPHEGYDRLPPATPYYVSVEFSDRAQAEACWAYVEEDAEPLSALHRAVNSKVRNASFFLCSDV